MIPIGEFRLVIVRYIMSNTKGKQTVLVLGAGFTKAFCPSAPLLTDDYGLPDLLDQFRTFPGAKQLLELEDKMSNGLIHIERLMTRLDSGMPYDFEHHVNEEFHLLLEALKKKLKDKIDEALKCGIGLRERKLLEQLAQVCVRNRVNCITFNYDDLFDKFLFQAGQPTITDKEKDEPYWHPDGGYGFFSPPAEDCVRHSRRFMDITSMLLLKLHGSINWRVKHGYMRPFPVDAIVHLEDWLQHNINPSIPKEAVKRHLDPTPFLVPPVLIKTDLRDQPILQVVWSQAYHVLTNSKHAVFVGYSFPQTDIATVTLFNEALQHLDQSHIRVVNIVEKEQDIKKAYRLVFPKLADDQFDFRGALEWVEEFVTDDTS